MDKSFETAQWIWTGTTYGENEYAEFADSFVWNGGEASMRISVCGDYTLFVNGKYAASNQYGDFEHYKVYDDLDITGLLEPGENTVCMLVWYFGTTGMRYYTPAPGLIYEICADGNVAAASGSDTLSRRSRAYRSGKIKKISAQLGYSFAYDATSDDAWLHGCRDGFAPSAVISKKRELTGRPTKKLVLEPQVNGSITKGENTYIIDLGREVVGLSTFSFVSDCEQDINVAYGELLENGHVKRHIGDRDFSFEYRAKSGSNEYTNYMFRLACRYIEIESEYPIDIGYVGIVPQVYPVTAKQPPVKDGLDRQIYDICLNTLKLCMMEHYVDCPWREQCLYAFDSRNQMLSGYVAFEGGNAAFARANLLLMSKDSREDGLLSICFPSASDLTIPSFSLYFILAVKEYLDYTGDLSLGEEVFAKAESILGVFRNNMKDGLVCNFEGSNRWSFYDWSPYAYSQIGQGTAEPDFLLNCIFVIALNAYADICSKLSKNNSFDGLAQEISALVRERFFNRETGMFYISDIGEEPTELANSLAVLAGIATGDTAEQICAQLAADKLISCSLSMKTFKYDALLAVGKDRYKDIILDEIRRTYKKMLDAGSDTVWETIEGAAAFDNAGSLCHGWSAIPVYYYDLFSR